MPRNPRSQENSLSRAVRSMLTQSKLPTDGITSSAEQLAADITAAANNFEAACVQIGAKYHVRANDVRYEILRRAREL